MEEPVPILAARCRGQEPRRVRRARILTALKDVCLQIECLQRSAQDRLACREIVRMLDEALTRENTPRAVRRR